VRCGEAEAPKKTSQSCKLIDLARKTDLTAGKDRQPLYHHKHHPQMSNTELSTAAAQSVSKTGIVLQTMDEIWRFAETVIASGMAPKGINNAAAATITIQMGLEVGLPPMAALQNIAPINGRPSIWGDAMLGVVRSTGDLEEFSEWYELAGERIARPPAELPDDLMAVCRVKRRGYDAKESSFSVADAKRAKLWLKQGPWTEYPTRMLKFRARSFGLRDEFGDALRGLHSVEEMRDAPPEMRDVTPQTTATPQKVITGGNASPARTRRSSSSAQAPSTSAEIPPRMDMVKAIKESHAAININTAEAQNRYRSYGCLAAGKSLADTTDEELHAIYLVRDAALKAEPPTEVVVENGGTDA
jgi:hypothetical protein